MQSMNRATLLEKLDGLPDREAQVVWGMIHHWASWKQIERVYPWVASLDEPNKAVFLTDLVQTVHQIEKTGDSQPLHTMLSEWEATADILGDEELAESLKQGQKELAQGDWVAWDILKDDV